MKNGMFYGKNGMGVTVDEFIQKINAYILWHNVGMRQSKIAGAAVGQSNCGDVVEI
jgi:hypothetical protein